jgi:hypothetical protein
MSSSSPERKKQRLVAAAGLDDLPVTVLELIFSFMTHDVRYDTSDGNWPLQLKPLFCKDWSNVSRTSLVKSMPEWSLLAFYSDSFARRICILRDHDHYMYGFDAIVDVAYISRFHELQFLNLENLSLNGTHPFIFNSFPYLRRLVIKSMPQLEFNLDMLSGMSLIRDIKFYGCSKLQGTLDSLRALKDTLRVVEICD